MNKDLKIVHNVLQCLLCNSSRFHYLEPLRKGVIEKMAYLVEFWLILERELVEHSPHTKYLLYGYENGTQNTTDCTLTNTFCLTKFGYVMKKL
jgi:hypothetical protein